MIRTTLLTLVATVFLLGCGDSGQRAIKAAAEAVLEDENTEQVTVNQQPNSQEAVTKPEQPLASNTVQVQETQVSPKPIKLEPVPPQPTIIEKPTYRIQTKTDGFIYMRNDKFAEAEKTHKLLDGTKVDIYECYDKENRVDVNSGNVGRWCLAEVEDGTRGYIFSSYVTPRID